MPMSSPTQTTRKALRWHHHHRQRLSASQDSHWDPIIHLLPEALLIVLPPCPVHLCRKTLHWLLSQPPNLANALSLLQVSLLLNPLRQLSLSIQQAPWHQSPHNFLILHIRRLLILLAAYCQIMAQILAKLLGLICWRLGSVRWKKCCRTLVKGWRSWVGSLLILDLVLFLFYQNFSEFEAEQVIPCKSKHKDNARLKTNKVIHGSIGMYWKPSRNEGKLN